MGETCFVIMPIGNQFYDGIEYKEEELKKKYDDLIKEALLSAKRDLQILRADDISSPGSITNDILSRIMFAKYVIADISLPNPNVYYELGLRHACNTRTILIKDKNIKNSVFDISHLRYIEYENTSTGLKELSNKLKKTFDCLDHNPDTPDNQFIELAGFLKFQYPKFVDYDEERRKKQQAITGILKPFMKDPERLKILFDPTISQEEKNVQVARMMQEDPNLLLEIIEPLIMGDMLEIK